MTERMTAEQARQLLASPKQTKYRAVRTVGADGRTYASKLEARHSEALDAQKRAGLIRGWLPQCSLPVPGTSRRLVVDFLIVDNEGRLKIHDTKGVLTREWAIKKELIERALGTPIDLVRRTR
jgi:hypothetical protein